MFIFLIFLFLNEYNCFVINPGNNSDIYDLSNLKSVNNGSAPSQFDWRQLGALSPVKNQDRCGAGWAFSVVANIESQYLIHFKIELNISEQFLIDCDQYDDPCHEGSIVQTFVNLALIGGVPVEEDYYPYVNQRMKCRWKHPWKPEPTVTGFKRVLSFNERAMVEALYSYGPLSASINLASMRYLWKGGDIIDQPTDEECEPYYKDHAVLIVGYGVKDTESGEVPYWIIKNSWGSAWGDGGYYYLVRGRNACGIESDVALAFVI